MRIVTVAGDDEAQIQAMARLLVEGFRVTAPAAWPTLDEALEEVRENLQVGFCRAALDDSGAVLGWVGGRHQHDSVWELHPLVVAPAAQGQGVGRALMLDFEDQVQQRDGLIIVLSFDDQVGLTTLSGVDLYEDLPGKLAAAQAKRPHQLEFYRRMGYTLVGVVPDANGRGNPDIVMAKRL
jgi:aminoglycoside 6'-N-acetyltransferase I